MLREFVGKRHEAGADLDQSVSSVHIGNIGKLGVRDVQQLRKFQSVRGCLIEHHNKLGVGQHRSCRMGLEQVVHILRDAGGIGSVLSHSLPQSEQEVCTVLVLEQKVDFINSLLPVSVSPIAVTGEPVRLSLSYQPLNVYPV